MYRKCMDKRSVIEIFDEVAEKYKNKPAIVFEEERFTYRELQKRSEIGWRKNPTRILLLSRNAFQSAG